METSPGSRTGLNALWMPQLAALVVSLWIAAPGLALGTFGSTLEYTLDVDAATFGTPESQSVFGRDASPPVDEMLEAESTFSEMGSVDFASASADLQIADTTLDVFDVRGAIALRTLREAEEAMAFAAIFVQVPFSTDSSGAALSLDGIIDGGVVTVQLLENGETDVATFTTLDGTESLELDPDSDYQLVVEVFRTISGIDQQVAREVDVVATLPEAGSGIAGSAAVFVLLALRRRRTSAARRED